ncbi:potassium channel protein [Chitinophagaceae bacterium LB-8]|uniref:Potassium channel protein n=1 Tax=Paraflavisolibacter caeni TaxID=2982496 RepID=A0A9X3BGH2_9BACT|nr:potassium channel protein [Paraflavisolibacter caeni]MCU7550899.1 potassium channel protein [Paraflavisolibacter caeni]
MPQLVKTPPFKRWFLMILAIIIFGVCGYIIIEGFSLLDALYMAMITITTIGYHEIRPLSEQGKIFNVIFIIASFSTISYLLAKLTQYVVSGELSQYFKTKRLMQALEQKKNHVIICGFGRNGQQAAKTLRAHKIDYVVIEKNHNTLDHYLLHDPKCVYLVGDATDDEILVQAGVERAKAILVTLPEDADNVFIVLSARSLNPKAQIIGRASSHGATAKLYKAGANNVIMPDMIGGTHMATLVSKPDVIEFIDFLSGEEGEAIHIEAVNYDQLPPHVRDKSLKEIMNWKKTGVNCIGIKDEQGRFNINPPDTIIISHGMKVIVFGTREQISAMKKNVGD